MTYIRKRALASCFVVAIAASSAHANQAVFDTEKCGIENLRDIAIAAGDETFSVPATALIDVVTPPESDISTKDDTVRTATQEGCPQNPVKGEVFTLIMRELVPPSASATTKNLLNGTVRIIRNDDSNTRFEATLARNYARLCDQKRSVVLLDKGVTECRFSAQPASKYGGQSRVFQISDLSPDDPEQSVFVISTQGMLCIGALPLTPTIRVTYRFPINEKTASEVRNVHEAVHDALMSRWQASAWASAFSS